LAPVLVPSLSQLQGRTFWWPSRAPKSVAPEGPEEHDAKVEALR
jgi:uncharacterized membrane protein YdfJ with MMPL/SSD domain